MKKSVILGCFISLSLSLACSPHSEKMSLPADLELVNQGSEQDSVCISCSHQVVVFHDFDKSSFFVFSSKFRWAEFREEFPEVGFLFYFSGEDRNKLVQELQELDFPFPAFHDPDFRFYHANRLDTVTAKYDVLHSFHLKEGNPIKRAEIGMGPQFIEELELVLAKK